MAGVAAGLGRRYGIDPVLVRILFVVATFAAGLGALAYLVLWVALPRVEAPAPPDTTRGADRSPAFWVGAIAITVGGVVALSELPAPRILVPLALITLGVALWQRPGGSGTAPGQPGVTATPADATTGPAADDGSWQPPPLPGAIRAGVQDQQASGRIDDASGVASDRGADGSWTPTAMTAGPVSGPDAGWDTASPRGRTSPGTATLAAPSSDPAAPGDGPAWEPTPDVRWWVPPSPRPRPSWLGPITIAVALVLTGLVALLGQADVVAPTAVDLVGVALLVLAGGLLVGAVRGRAKWLVLPSLVLTGVLVLAQGASGLGLVLTPTFGVRDVRPGTIAEAADIHHGAGELLVDLSETDLGGGGPVEVNMGAGQVHVIVPAGARVDLRVVAGIGEVSTIGAPVVDVDGVARVSRDQLAVGSRLDVERVLEPRGATQDTVELDVVVGVGEVEVFRGVEAYELGVERFDLDDGDDIVFDFDLGQGGSATIELDDEVDRGFRGHESAVTWLFEEECPAAAFDDDLLELCLRALSPGPPLSAEGHSLAEQFFIEECATEAILDDPDTLLEPCLRLILPDDDESSDVPNDGGN